MDQWRAGGKSLVKVKLHIEGGGDNKVQHQRFRRAWTRFFQKAGLKKMPQTVAGGGRKRTFDRFRTAVRNEPDMCHILLVDSEDVVAPGTSPWQHLKQRQDDNFDKPPGVAEDDASLMICTMETWFVADRRAISAFFGQGFNDGALPKWPNLEQVRKRDILNALVSATKACGPRAYAKGDLSVRVLAALDPNQVEQHCPAARRLLDRLRDLLS